MPTTKKVSISLQDDYSRGEFHNIKLANLKRNDNNALYYNGLTITNSNHVSSASIKKLLTCYYLKFNIHFPSQ